jgi:hypothetical protein
MRKLKSAVIFIVAFAIFGALQGKPAHSRYEKDPYAPPPGYHPEYDVKANK